MPVRDARFKLGVPANKNRQGSSMQRRSWHIVGETTETIEPDGGERSKVESWRLHVLMEAGYPLPLAEKLAGSEVDLHRAVELVGQGCTPQTAVEILL
jgi:hypothetical protein